MMEPRIARLLDFSDAVPYSQLPIGDLQRVAAGQTIKGETGNEFYDDAFRRMYAARLLRERGL